MDLKRIFLYALCSLVVLSLCSLCSCGAERISSGDKIQAYFEQLNGFKSDIDLTFETYGRVDKFTFSYEFSGDDTDEIVINAPEELSGIAVSISNDSSSVTWRDTVVDMGQTAERPSPFSAVAYLIMSWQSGYIMEVSKEKLDGEICIALTIADAERDPDVTYRTWFLQDSFVPLYAEIYLNESRYLQCSFADFKT